MTFVSYLKSINFRKLMITMLPLGVALLLSAAFGVAANDSPTGDPHFCGFSLEGYYLLC